MKTLIKNRTLHYAIVLAAVLFGLYAFFVASPLGQAVSNTEIGSLTADLVPSPVSAGVESVTLEFNSNSGAGQLDISNWVVTNGGDFAHTLPSGTILASGNSLKICADQSVEDCTEWEGGNDVWGNSTDDFILRDNTGKNVFKLTYSVTPGTGKLVTVIHSVTEPVYSHNDKIVMCVENNKGSLTSKSSPAGKYIKAYLAGRKGAHEDPSAIVPAFYYNFGEGIEFYGGKLWPEGKSTHDAGCV